MSFNSDLRRSTKNISTRAEKMFRAKVLSICNSIIRRTPKKTGRLQGNWQASINTPKSSEIDQYSFDIVSVEQTYTQLSNGDTAYFVNNLPYAHAIEHGHSKKNPLGMMRISVLEASD